MDRIDGFHHIPLLEHWSGRLRLAADHAVVGHWQQGWQGRNRHPRNRLFLVEAPAQAGEIAWGDQRLLMRSGHRYLMPTGAELDFRFAAGLRMVAFHFDCELVPGLDCFAGETRLHEASCPAERTRRLAQRLLRLERPGDLLAACAELAALIADLVPLDWEGLREQEVVQRRYAQILRRIDREGAATRIALLAAELGLSADQLSKRFRRDLGIPLKTLIDQRVARRAASLLRETDKPIAAIAHELGFSSEFYASRFLKKHLGMSPRAYRQLPAEQRV
jgi:AraC-like DNA-binding protein